MNGPPIPQRIPPLTWRRPSLLWTPIALALAIGWPAALFHHDSGLQRLSLIAGAAVFALALVTLGLGWALGAAPKARRIVVLHIVVAGALASLLAPFVLTQLLALVADYEQAGAAQNFSFLMSLALAPLALVLGLPIALVSGIVFAWIALRPLPTIILSRDDVQPFR